MIATRVRIETPCNQCTELSTCQSPSCLKSSFALALESCTRWKMLRSWCMVHQDSRRRIEPKQLRSESVPKSKAMMLRLQTYLSRVTSLKEWKASANEAPNRGAEVVAFLTSQARDARCLSSELVFFLRQHPATKVGSPPKTRMAWCLRIGRSGGVRYGLTGVAMDHSGHHEKPALAVAGKG